MPADLSITKTDGTTSVVPGTFDTYTIVVSNDGPDTVTGASVSDLLPAGVDAATWTATSSSGGGSVSGASSGIGALATTVDLPAGASVTFSFTNQISPLATGTITNTATVSPPAGVTDSNPANNSATDTDSLTPQADLAIAKIVSNSTPNVGDQITFTVTVSNTGPDAATAVQVTDLLPAGLTFVSANPSQGSYDNATGVWDVGTVSPGGPQTLNITATVVSAAAQTNTAAISHADQFDPNTANNTASATETPQQADLAVIKSVSDADAQRRRHRSPSPSR